MTDKVTQLLRDAGLQTAAGSFSLSHLLPAAPPQSQAGGLTTIIQQATQQIQQLQTVTQQNIDTVAANTAALDSGSASSRFSSLLSSLLPGPSGLLGGLTGGLTSVGGLGGIGGIFSLFSGLAGLFGGGPSQPPPLVPYQAPKPVAFEESDSNGVVSDAIYNSLGQPQAAAFTELALSGINGSSRSASPGSLSTPGSSRQPSASQITVQVQAMDSQSFMDRSNDIAAAVRNAMLNMHSINDVIGDL